MTAARPSSATRPRSRSSSRACTETSRPPVGSSMKTRRGRVTRLRAICRRWRMPPEKVARRIVDAVAAISTRSSQSSGGAADAAVVALADRHQPLADIGAGRDRHAQAVAGSWWTKPQSVRMQEAPLGLAERREIASDAVAHAVADPPGGSARAAPTAAAAASSCRSRTRRRPPAPRRGTDRRRRRGSRAGGRTIWTGPRRAAEAYRRSCRTPCSSFRSHSSLCWSFRRWFPSP